MTDSRLSVDTLFDLLKNPRRRYLLYSLDEKTESVMSLDELTTLVLEWERQMGAGNDELTDERKRRIRLSLHHKHLPKLAEVDLVEYDSRSQTIRNRGTSSAVALAEKSHDEVAHLRSLLCQSTTE